jgi:hypothetical protein
MEEKKGGEKRKEKKRKEKRNERGRWFHFTSNECPLSNL